MSTTNNVPGWAIWSGLLRWDPFRIDALGLITLLGAEEVNASVGRLVRSKWLEYMPLLGGYVIANESFRDKVAGYHLYNISQGIHTTDLASWFSRWIKAQDFQPTRNFVRWTVTKERKSTAEDIVALSISVSLIGFLTAMTIISYDWYGFANAMSMALSVVVRVYMVGSVRKAVDKRVTEQVKEQHRIPPIGTCAHPLDNVQSEPELVKVLIVDSETKAITMVLPKQLIIPPSPFIAKLEPEHRWIYSTMKWLGWIAFAVQVVTIGMADLATQLVTVALIVIPTILHINKFGADDSQWEQIFRQLIGRPKKAAVSSSTPKDAETSQGHPSSKFEFQYECWIGSYLKAEVYFWPLNHEINNFDPRPSWTRPDHQKRQHLYAWLQLTETEQQSMDKWDLLPHRRDPVDEWIANFKGITKKVKDLTEGGHGMRMFVNPSSEA